MELKIYVPFKPMYITQEWGVPNPLYEQYGFKLHNGLDCKRNFFDVKYPLYCPVEGFHVQQVIYTAGGGNEIYLISDQPLLMGDRECYAWIVFMHNAKIFLKAGDKPAIGELLAIGDNTGNSTGPHTHFGLYRTDIKGNKLDVNDANGSVNPTSYFFPYWQTQPKYAIDEATVATLLKNNWRYYQWIIGL